MLKLNFIRKIRACKGQSIVEISLIAPLLLVALYIPADFGIAMFTAHLTQNAVREAARIGVSTRDPFDNAAANAIVDCGGCTRVLVERPLIGQMKIVEVLVGEDGK